MGIGAGSRLLGRSRAQGRLEVPLGDGANAGRAGSGLAVAIHAGPERRLVANCAQLIQEAL